MAKIKRKVARKAVASTAKHSLHGTASKLKRDPFRAVALLAIGVAIGAAVAWLLGSSDRAAGGPAGGPTAGPA
jgi:hypothetical protein